MDSIEEFQVRAFLPEDKGEQGLCLDGSSQPPDIEWLYTALELLDSVLLVFAE